MFVDGIKYACATCIKGHRSSQCQHADRPLVAIRRKGRPVSQCGYCRDLRKTKQMHVKCVCKSKSGGVKDEVKEPAATDTAPVNTSCRQHSTCTCPGKLATKKNISSNSPEPVVPSPPSPTLRIASSTLLHRRQQRHASMSAVTAPPVQPDPVVYPDLAQPVSSMPVPLSTGISEPTTCDAESVSAPSVSPVALNHDEVWPSLNGWDSLETASKLVFPTPQCGSLVPHSHCSAHWEEQGQSVIVTLTPIPKSGHQGLSTPISNIVTCYCGLACTCPGCLVHPNPTFLPPSSNSTYSSSDDGYTFSASSSSSCA